MKAIAIVELPDDAFEWGGKWMIDDKGAIRYNWMHYKDIDACGIELRPLPKEKDNRLYISNHPTNEIDIEEDEFANGWNACLEEILGETE